MFADLESGDLYGSDLRANQFEHLGIECLYHPTHLPVASLRDRNFEKGVAG